jgi:hypothetical protein
MKRPTTAAVPELFELSPIGDRREGASAMALRIASGWRGLMSAPNAP